MDERKDLKDWAHKVVEKSRPGIAESESFCSIVTENFLDDPVCATELGMAIFMDKPIILMVKTGTKLPKHLEKVADGVVYFQDKNDLANASVRFKAILDKLEADKKQ